MFPEDLFVYRPYCHVDEYGIDEDDLASIDIDLSRLRVKREAPTNTLLFIHMSKAQRYLLKR